MFDVKEELNKDSFREQPVGGSKGLLVLPNKWILEEIIVSRHCFIYSTNKRTRNLTSQRKVRKQLNSKKNQNYSLFQNNRQFCQYLFVKANFFTGCRY